jgi:hypothetical protein
VEERGPSRTARGRDRGVEAEAHGGERAREDFLARAERAQTRRRLPVRDEQEWEGRRATRGGDLPQRVECPTCGQWTLERSADARPRSRDEDEGAGSSLPRRRGGHVFDADEERHGRTARGR